MSADDFNDGDDVVFGRTKKVETTVTNVVRHVDTKAKFAMSAIMKLLNTAAESGLASPSFRAEGLIISRAPSTGKNPGATYVKRDNEARTYIGKIVANGEWFPQTVATMGDGEALKRICENPLEMMIAYGHKTGSCSCCGRELTNRISVKLGIGPICRGRYGFGGLTEEESEGYSAEEIENQSELAEAFISSMSEPLVSAISEVGAVLGRQEMLNELSARTNGIPEFAQTALQEMGMSPKEVSEAHAYGKSFVPQMDGDDQDDDVIDNDFVDGDEKPLDEMNVEEIDSELAEFFNSIEVGLHDKHRAMLARYLYERLGA